MDKKLEVSLGLRGVQFPTYPTIRVDNGDDKKGTNRTGEFVEKEKDENEETQRTKWGKVIQGVVLMTRAKCNSPYKKGVEGWYTHEFNPFEKNELITIVKGKTSSKATYEQIKNKFSVDNGDGTRKNNYVYKTVLYLGLPENKIVKLILTGKSQGNWFDYQGAIKGSLLEKMTIFEIVKNEEDDYFEAVVKTGDEKTDANENLERAKDLMSTEKPRPVLEAPEQNQIESPTMPEKNEIPVVDVEEEETPSVDIEDDPNEIKVSEIPFS
jgi:hypothetical protein